MQDPKAVLKIGALSFRGVMAPLPVWARTIGGALPVLSLLLSSSLFLSQGTDVILGQYTSAQVTVFPVLPPRF